MPNQIIANQPSANGNRAYMLFIWLSKSCHMPFSYGALSLIAVSLRFYNITRHFLMALFRNMLFKKKRHFVECYSITALTWLISSSTVLPGYEKAWAISKNRFKNSWLKCYGVDIDRQTEIHDHSYDVTINNEPRKILNTFVMHVQTIKRFHFC